MRTRIAAVAGAAVLGAAVFSATPATAEGFVVEARAETPLSPTQAYRAFVHVERWWSGAHTYSGDARSLRLESRAGGCWCERLANGGSVEHMRVVYAAPGQSMRLVGGLGPLQAMPVNAVMSVTFAGAPSGAGAGSVVTLTYAVAGPGTEPLQAPVSNVIREQFARYAASVEGASKP